MRKADGSTGTSSPYISATACGKLKATSGWYNNGNGTDEYKFSALPGGFRHSGSSGDYGDVGKDGEWWSSTEPRDSANANCRYMLFDCEVGTFCAKAVFRSVRCVQD